MRKMINYQTVVVSSINQKIKRNGVVTKNCGDGITIRCTKAKDFIIGEELIIKTMNREVGQSNYSGIIGGIIENSILIKNLRLIYSKQERKKVRVIVNFPLEVDKIKKEESGLISLKKPIFMVSKNISGEGILLESNLDIPMDVHFLVEIPLPNGTIKVETKTVRKYTGNNLNYYGCVFTMLSKENKEILDSFIIKNHNSKFYRYYKVNY
ncbi:MAG: PilZ domain-containing protein [Clostridium sp.]